VGPRNFKCPYCDQRFSSHLRYDKHLETHLAKE
jgi:uncharacterized C2H2 Zn-finger protein